MQAAVTLDTPWRFSAAVEVKRPDANLMASFHPLSSLYNFSTLPCTHYLPLLPWLRVHSKQLQLSSSSPNASVVCTFLQELLCSFLGHNRSG